MNPVAWALFGLTVLLDVFGQTAFKLGLDRIGEGQPFWRGVATSPWIVAGFLGYCIEAVCWMYVLGHAPLSIVGPMAALSYVGAVLAGRLFLGERPRARRWLAAGLVTIGAGLVGRALADLPTLPQKSLARAIAGWLLFIAVETATQVTFKFAGATLDDSHGLAGLIKHGLQTPIVLLGFVLYFAGFLVWLTILKDIDLGRAFPMTAMIYVSTLVAAVVLFHERLNGMRIAGVVVIGIGVALLASDGGQPDRDRL